jgi:hypothetical protein
MEGNKMKFSRLYQRSRGQAASRALGFITFAFFFGLCLPLSLPWLDSLLKEKLKFDNAPGYIIGIIITLSSVLISFDNVTKVIEEAIESDVSLKVKNQVKEIQEEYNKKSPEYIKEKQELEFLAIWTGREHINHIDFNEMSLNLRQKFMRDRDEFTNITMRDFKERFYARKELIDKLDGEEGKKILQSIVKEAMNHVLNKSRDEEVSTSENKKYLKTEAILRAWLICSIKYDTPMPIQSLKKIIGSSQDEIQALKYIKDKMLADTRIIKRLTNPMSREIVNEYIDDFIKLITS